MQTAKQVLDTYFLDMRHALLEVAAMFDRYDAARRRTGEGDDDFRRRKLQDAVCILAEGGYENRAENLLNLFSDLDEETQEGKRKTHPF